MKRFGKNVTIYILVFALVMGFFWFFNNESEPLAKEIKTSMMINHLKQGEVESIDVAETKLTAQLNSGETVYAYVNSAVDMSFIYEKYIIPQEMCIRDRATI